MCNISENVILRRVKKYRFWNVAHLYVLFFGDDFWFIGKPLIHRCSKSHGCVNIPTDREIRGLESTLYPPCKKVIPIPMYILAIPIRSLHMGGYTQNFAHITNLISASPRLKGLSLLLTMLPLFSNENRRKTGLKNLQKKFSEKNICKFDANVMAFDCTLSLTDNVATFLQWKHEKNRVENFANFFYLGGTDTFFFL